MRINITSIKTVEKITADVSQELLQSYGMPPEIFKHKIQQHLNVNNPKNKITVVDVREKTNHWEVKFEKEIY